MLPPPPHAPSLTDLLSGVESLILGGDRVSGRVLVAVLYEGVTLVHRDADDVAVALEYRSDVVLRQHERVQVADEDARVDRLRVVRVGDVADLSHDDDGTAVEPAPRNTVT